MSAPWRRRTKVLEIAMRLAEAMKELERETEANAPSTNQPVEFIYRPG